MSYSQFGYSYPAGAPPLTSSQVRKATSQLLMSGSAVTSIATSCCENGRPIMTDPHTGQTVCSCQYGSSLLAYSRVPGLTDTVYGAAPYGTQGYMSLGTADPSAFYSPLNAPYDLKENAAEAWRSITQPGYPYDAAMAPYPYGNSYGSMDLNGAARRKNATRETTTTLKAWLYEHKKNPYPTKGEKIMLAIVTKMTLTQVSTWFANARRRLKKENKMTWSPRNRCGDDQNDDKLDSDGEEEGKDSNDMNNSEESRDIGSDIDVPRENDKDKKRIDCNGLSASMSNSPAMSPFPNGDRGHAVRRTTSSANDDSDISDDDEDSLGAQKSESRSDMKPRIWSIAHTATSSSPPLGTVRNVTLPPGLSSKMDAVPSPGGVRSWLDSAFPTTSGFSSLSSPFGQKFTDSVAAGANSGSSTTPPSGIAMPTLLRSYPQSSMYSPAMDLSRYNGSADRLGSKPTMAS